MAEFSGKLIILRHFVKNHGLNNDEEVEEITKKFLTQLIKIWQQQYLSTQDILQ